MSARAAGAQSALAKARPGKKKTKAELEEEERLAREAAEREASLAAAAAIPPSPFTRLEEVWALGHDLPSQRALVAQLLDLSDGPGVCAESLRLDDAMELLHFTRSAGLNSEQARVFFDTMRTLQQRMGDPQANVEECFAWWKSAILQNCDAMIASRGSAAAAPAVPAPAASSDPVPHMSLPVPASRRPGSSKGERPTSSSSRGRASSSASSLASSSASASAAAAAPAASPAAAAAGGAAAKAGGATGPITPRGAGEEPQTPGASVDANGSPLATPPGAPLPKTFTVAQVKSLTEYVTRGYFAHFRLLQAVFHPHIFRPRKMIVQQRLRLETPVPDELTADGSAGGAFSSLSLDAAVQIDVERERRKREAEEAQARKQEETEEKSQADTWSATSPDLQPRTRSPSRPSSALLAPSSSSSAAAAALAGLSGAAAGALVADEPLPSDDLSQLVHLHMQKVRGQLLALVAEQEKQLEAKLRGVEERLATASAHAKPGAAAGKKK